MSPQPKVMSGFDELLDWHEAKQSGVPVGDLQDVEVSLTKVEEIRLLSEALQVVEKNTSLEQERFDNKIRTSISRSRIRPMARLLPEEDHEVRSKVGKLTSPEVLKDFFDVVIRKAPPIFSRLRSNVALQEVVTSLVELAKSDEEAKATLDACCKEVHNLFTDSGGIPTGYKSTRCLLNSIRYPLLTDVTEQLAIRRSHWEPPADFLPKAYTFCVNALSDKRQFDTDGAIRSLAKASETELAFIADHLMYPVSDEVREIRKLASVSVIPSLLERLDKEQVFKIGEHACEMLKTLDTKDGQLLESLASKVKGGSASCDSDRSSYLTKVAVGSYYLSALSESSKVVGEDTPSSWRSLLIELSWHPQIERGIHPADELDALKIAGNFVDIEDDQLILKARLVYESLSALFEDAKDVTHASGRYRGTAILRKQYGMLEEEPRTIGMPRKTPRRMIRPRIKESISKLTLSSDPSSLEYKETSCEMFRHGRALYLLLGELARRGISDDVSTEFLLENRSKIGVRPALEYLKETERTVFQMSSLIGNRAFEASFILSDMAEQKILSRELYRPEVRSLIREARDTVRSEVFVAVVSVLNEFYQNDAKFSGTLFEKVAYDNLPAEPDVNDPHIEYGHQEHIERAMVREQEAIGWIDLTKEVICSMSELEDRTQQLDTFIDVLDGQRINAARFPSLLSDFLDDVLVLFPEDEHEMWRERLGAAIKSKDTQVIEHY